MSGTEGKEMEQPQGFGFWGTHNHMEGEGGDIKSMSLGSEQGPSRGLTHT